MHNQTIRIEDSMNEEGIHDEVLFWKEYRQRRIDSKDEFSKLRTQNAISFAQQRFDAYLLNGSLKDNTPCFRCSNCVDM